MLSFPYNSSSPILYFNKAAFAQAGLDASSPPETWPEVFDAARRIKESGWPCGLTTTWPTWIGLENFSAWNNVPYGTKQNGLEGAEVELLINSQLRSEEHTSELQYLQRISSAVFYLKKKKKQN